jgi:hypothetical protein
MKTIPRELLVLYLDIKLLHNDSSVDAWGSYIYVSMYLPNFYFISPNIGTVLNINDKK